MDRWKDRMNEWMNEWMNEYLATRVKADNWTPVIHAWRGKISFPNGVSDMRYVQHLRVRLIFCSWPVLWEILKNKQQVPAPPSYSSPGSLTGQFLSHGDSLTQSSKISPPSLLGSHWWVITMPAPCFKTPMAFVVHTWQTHALWPYLSLLNPDELPLKENKTQT